MTKKGGREIAGRRNWGLGHWSDNGGSALDLFMRDRDGLQRGLDRMFEDFWQENSGRWPLLANRLDFGYLNPDVDQTEDDKAYYVRAELPGMDESEVEVAFNDGVLTISGEKKEEKEEKSKGSYRRECSFGEFRRSLLVPGAVDEAKISAFFKKGVLNIELPKTREAQKKARRIAVKAADAST